MPIKLLTILLTLLLGRYQLSAQFQLAYGDNSIISVKAIDSLSVVNPADGTVWYLHDSCRVHYYKDLIMYQTYYRFTRSDPQGDVEFEESRPEYLVFHHDSTYGIEYDSLSKYYHKRRTLVDSAFLMLTFTQINQMYSMFQDKDSLRFISAQKNKEPGKFIEKYLFVNVRSITDFDTAYLYFDKGMNHIPLSFMRGFDSLKTAKLHRIRFVFNATYSKENGGNIDKREWYFDMKEEKDYPNKEDVIKYFRMYEAEILKR